MFPEGQPGVRDLLTTNVQRVHALVEYIHAIVITLYNVMHVLKAYMHNDTHYIKYYILILVTTKLYNYTCTEKYNSKFQKRSL